MLRTLFLLGLIVIVGSVLFGLVFGVALVVLGFVLKAVIVGAVVYFIIRIVSPNTAAAIRQKLNGESLPRF